VNKVALLGFLGLAVAHFVQSMEMPKLIFSIENATDHDYIFDWRPDTNGFVRLIRKKITIKIIPMGRILSNDKEGNWHNSDSWLVIPIEYGNGRGLARLRFGKSVAAKECLWSSLDVYKADKSSLYETDEEKFVDKNLILNQNLIHEMDESDAQKTCILHVKLKGNCLEESEIELWRNS
jgi:hypothetical protein